MSGYARVSDVTGTCQISNDVQVVRTFDAPPHNCSVHDCLFSDVGAHLSFCLLSARFWDLECVLVCQMPTLVHTQLNRWM